MHTLPVRLLLLGLISTACAARSTAPPDRTLPPPPALEADGLLVTLTWNPAVDLDLYVTDPSWETVYFANNPARSGAALVGDERCTNINERTVPTERVHVPAPAAKGSYRVGVDFIDRCGSEVEAAPYRIVVDAGGERLTKSGVASFERFEVRAFEFRLVERADGSIGPMSADGAAPSRRPDGE